MMISLKSMTEYEYDNKRYYHDYRDCIIKAVGLDMESLILHKPTENMQISICDTFQDFDFHYNPYTCYILRIYDGGYLWTIKTRYSKLLSFHKALKYDPLINNKQDIMKELQFPRKSVFCHFNHGLLKKRNKKLKIYLDKICQYHEILLSQTMRDLVIPHNFIF
mmetsp:Transcript_4067/g.3535  ORF Transcript_4067/g.3535 Transcript_4067/m.3535 type:complete len:164 (-) Transcript_4067:30-521(-)